MKKIILSTFLFMAFVLAACGPAKSIATSATAAPKPTDAPTMTSANFPTGKFIKSGTTNYGLVFNPDGTFSVFDGGSTFVHGTYSVSGNVFTETSNDGGCVTNVNFNYVFDGKNLTLSYVGNPADDADCTGRNADFNNVTYSLVDQSAEPAVPAALPEIKVDAADFSYTAPETVNAGWVRVILTNSGSEPHHVQFLRLNDGVTVDQFETALKQAEGPALAMTKQVGGVGAIAPGLTAQSVINLSAGQYVILCLVPSPSDHVAHHEKGMIKTLTVEQSQVSVGEPTAGMNVHLKDFAFDLPDSLPAGPVTIKVINDGPEPHEFNILKLADGKTAADVMQFLSGAAGGPPPFTPVGGMNGLDMGLWGYAELNLEPGTYAAICNIPSPKAEGHPHFTLGMIKQFTVGGVADSGKSKFPTGKFIRSDNPDAGVIFNQNGTWSAFSGPFTLAKGTYRVDGSVYTELSSNSNCPEPMNFKFTFDGKELKFRYEGDPNQDPCDGRRDGVNDRTYLPSK